MREDHDFSNWMSDMDYALSVVGEDLTNVINERHISTNKLWDAYKNGTSPIAFLNSLG
jgi:hypothetical protein